MTRLTRNQHKARASIGILFGVAMATVAAVVSYYDYLPGKGTKWALLMLPALPFAAWGASHLARLRGYPSAAGYGLFVFGFFASSLIAGSSTPVTVGFAFLFVALLPPVVLLALPKKTGLFRRE